MADGCSSAGARGEALRIDNVGEVLLSGYSKVGGRSARTSVAEHTLRVGLGGAGTGRTDMLESPEVTDQVVVEPSYNGVASEPVVRASLSNQVAERLRNDIVNHRILPGARLVQDELCQRYGTSRMPVRDALRQLTHEGILERQGHQLVVASLGVEDLEEVHSLTAVLHGWAAGQAATVATDAELAELDDICQAGLETEDPFEFGRLSMDFHRKINLLAHSQRLYKDFDPL